MEKMEHRCALGQRRLRPTWLPIWAAMLFLLNGVAVFAQTSDVAKEEPLIRARIQTTDAQGVMMELERAGFDVLRGSLTASTLEVVVSTEELELIKERGLQVIATVRGRPFNDLIQEEDVPANYSDLAAVLDQMNEFAAMHPSIAKVVDLTTKYGVPPTFEGRHMFAMKISDNVADEEDEPAVLIVSNHHCRELVTTVIALNAMEQLTAGYGSDPQITDAVDNQEIWIAATWNPDGYNHVFTRDDLWRKNRRVLSGGIGVDLNRNYPQGWNTSCSGSTTVSSNTYKGPSPASEPETQTMMAWSLDQRFAKVIDYHSRGREALWGYSCPSHPFDTWLRNEARALATASSYGTSQRPPSADGEHYQWQLGQMGAWSFLIETHTAFQPSFNSAMNEADRVWPGILYGIERPISLSGHVTDGRSGSPLETDIELIGVNFSAGETNSSGGPFGKYHAFLPAGSYEIRFSAAGYLPQAHNVTIANDTTTAEVLDVELRSEASIPPAAPTDLVATAGNGSVTLDWTDNSELDVTGYNVLRATVAGGPYIPIDTVLESAYTTLAYSIARPTTTSSQRLIRTAWRASLVLRWTPHPAISKLRRLLLTGLSRTTSGAAPVGWRSGEKRVIRGF